MYQYLRWEVLQVSKTLKKLHVFSFSSSETQVDVIKKTWEIPASKPLDSGETILFLFLEKFPHNQQKFAAFK